MQGYLKLLAQKSGHSIEAVENMLRNGINPLTVPVNTINTADEAKKAEAADEAKKAADEAKKPADEVKKVEAADEAKKAADEVKKVEAADEAKKPADEVKKEEALEQYEIDEISLAKLVSKTESANAKAQSVDSTIPATAGDATLTGDTSTAANAKDLIVVTEGDTTNSEFVTIVGDLVADNN